MIPGGRRFVSFLLVGAEGNWRGDSSTVGDRTIERPAGLGVVEKLRRRQHLSVEEFVFLRARTTRARDRSSLSRRCQKTSWLPAKELQPRCSAHQLEFALQARVLLER